MKQNQIFIAIGVIALILIVMNWNKIFKPKQYRFGGGKCCRGRNDKGECTGGWRNPPCSDTW